MLSSIAPFVSLFVFHHGQTTSCQPIGSSQLRMLYTWPRTESEATLERAGIVEALLLVIKNFILPLPEARVETTVEQKIPRGRLVLQSQQHVLVAQAIPNTWLYVVLICVTASAKPAQRVGFKKQTSVPTVCKADPALSTHDSVFFDKTFQHVHSLHRLPPIRTLERYIQQLTLFHAPLLNDTRLRNGPSPWDIILQQALAAFTPRFLYSEAADYWHLHTQLLSGTGSTLSYTQMGHLNEPLHLEIEMFLRETELIATQDFVRIAGTALLLNGFVVGGSAAALDMAAIQEYVSGYASGRMSNMKLNQPPWHAWESTRIWVDHCASAAVITTPSYDKSLSQTFSPAASLFGVAHDLTPSPPPSSRHCDKEGAPSALFPGEGGFLLGLRTLSNSDALSVRNPPNDAPSSLPECPSTEAGFLCVPRIYLPSGLSVYLVAFAYGQLLLILLVHNFGALEEEQLTATRIHAALNSSTKDAEEPFTEPGLFGPCRSVALGHWFKSLAYWLLSLDTFSLRTLTRKITERRKASQRHHPYKHLVLPSGEDERRFMSWNHAAHLWYRSSNTFNAQYAATRRRSSQLRPSLWKRLLAQPLLFKPATFDRRGARHRRSLEGGSKGKASKASHYAEETLVTPMVTSAEAHLIAGAQSLLRASTAPAAVVFPAPPPAGSVASEEQPHTALRSSLAGPTKACFERERVRCVGLKVPGTAWVLARHVGGRSYWLLGEKSSHVSFAAALEDEKIFATTHLAPI